MRRLWPVALIAILGACVHEKMEDAQPSIAAVRAARSFDMAPLAVGAVVAMPDGAAFDRSIVIRGSTMSPPGGRFSAYLRAVMIAELRAAGRYDPASPLTLSAVLTENSASEGFKSGTGRAAATFRVQRGDTTIYQTPIRAEIDWPSSFIGAIAIPNAFRTHSSLTNALVLRLFADPGFQSAVSKK